MVASGDANGSYLQARGRLRVFEVDGESSGYSLSNAYSIVVDALEVTPNHVPCLRLATRLYRRVHPNDWEGWWKLLQRRFRLEAPTPPILLLFDLALAACELEKYTDAKVYLDQLDEASIGHTRRTGAVAVIKDDGRDRRFVGEVRSGLTRIEGWLHCDAVGQEVRFVPLRQKFTPTVGQTVTFALALNYRGVFAVELRPD
jgi:hypothetical protein